VCSFREVELPLAPTFRSFNSRKRRYADPDIPILKEAPKRSTKLQ
jgi:hypothetical protein